MCGNYVWLFFLTVAAINMQHQKQKCWSQEHSLPLEPLCKLKLDKLGWDESPQVSRETLAWMQKTWSEMRRRAPVRQETSILIPLSTTVGWLGIAIMFSSFNILEEKTSVFITQKKKNHVWGGTNAYPDLNIAQHTWNITWCLLSMYNC